MKIAGIICEYNPFHNGHAYHIAKTRSILGADTTIVCVMSGNFVQRGDTAIFDKHTRAACAVAGGADLVIELPVPWALSSAESFARGGVSLLYAAGCGYISFGSECGDAETIISAAETLRGEKTQNAVKAELQKGKTYAAACAAALESVSPELGGLLSSPNDLLGIEYARASIALGGKLRLIAVKRDGADHDSPVAGASIASASFIREKLASWTNAESYMPTDTTRLIRGKTPVTLIDYEQAILSRLRMIKDADYKKLDAGREGFADRFMKYARAAPSIDALLSGVKTKRYPMSRIRRMMLRAAIGITAEDSSGVPPYIRVLAANKTGCRILDNMSAEVPVIVKPALVKKLGEQERHIFGLEAAATDLYALGRGEPGGMEWLRSPIIL